MFRLFIISSILLFLISGVTVANSTQKVLPIIPEPKICYWQEGEFSLNFETGIYYTPVYAIAAENINQQLNSLLSAELSRTTLSDDHYNKSGIFICGIEDKNLVLPFMKEHQFKFLPEMSKEGYVIAITNQKIILYGETNRAIFYAIQSLNLILSTSNQKVSAPALTIFDWPDFKMRGITDDMSRGQVSTLENFKKIIRFLAAHKMNVYMPYIEDIFRFEHFPTVGRDRGAIGADEWIELQDYAEQYYVEIIPIFQTLGHYENILNQPEFIRYAEFPGAASLNSVSEDTYTLLAKFLEEIVPVFRSEYFHIGADESWDVGKWASREMAQRHSIASVHAEHYRRVFGLLSKYNKKVMMYGDIILDHPSILNEITEDIIMFDWHYYPKDLYESTETFKKAGQPFIVSAGVHNWRNMFPNLTDAMANIRQLTLDGWRNGAIGSITSNWGDYGAMNLRELNYYPYAFAANCAWNVYSENLNLFENNFIRSFYGSEYPELASIYQMMNELSLEVNFLHFLGHPFYKPEGNPIDIIRRTFKLNRYASTINELLSTTSKVVKNNKDHLEYLSLCADFYQIYGQISEVQLHLVQINRYMIDPEKRKTQQPILLEKMSTVKKDIEAFNEQYSLLWKRHYRPDNLQIIRELLDRLGLYITIKAEEIKNNNYSFNGKIISKFISHPDALAEDIEIPKIYLRKEFNLPNSPDEAWIQIIADSHGKIWINDQFVGEIYARKSLSATVERERVRSFEISDLLRKGINLVCVEVKNYIPQGIASANIWLEYKVDKQWSAPIISDSYWKVSRRSDDQWLSKEFDDQYWELTESVPNKWHISRPYFQYNLPSRIEYYW